MKGIVSKWLSLLLAVSMLLTLTVPSAFAAPGDEPEAPTATFTAAEGGDVISLAESKTFTVMIPVDEALTQDAADAVNWSLDWDQESTDALYTDSSLFPNHIQGGDLFDEADWHTVDFYYWGGATYDPQPLFEKISCQPVTEGSQNYLELQFSNVIYWTKNGTSDPSAAHDTGGEYMDLCGIFDLTATAADGTVLGTVDNVLVSPYDNYTTMQNIYAQLDEMVDYAASATDLYVAKESMGLSSGQLYEAMDMPYLIIADDQSSVSEWLAFTEKAETDPEGVLADIAAGVYDELKVPVMFSNIHANEAAAADGVMAFAWMLIHGAAGDDIGYTQLAGFTDAGAAQVQQDLAADGVVTSELVQDLAEKLYPESGSTSYEDALNLYLGYLHADNSSSSTVDLSTYYDIQSQQVNVDTLLEDVFFVLVPEENVEGRMFMTRESSNGYDLNRDNSFQTTAETQNMQQLIGTFNPVSLMEFHGRSRSYQVEPCSPPHEPNFEYDLLVEHLLAAGLAYGSTSVANNEAYNSYVMPLRDYLYDMGGSNYWYPWDDMSTSYTPQFAMLHGTIAYTVELPGYNDDVVQAVQYGCLGMSDYIASEKLDILSAQTEIFARGVNNENSNDTVSPWLVDQTDTIGAEGDLFRPVYDGEGETGNFYPEFYIIPLDGENQSNLDAAYDMMTWLSRNDVKILITEKDYTFDGVTYPAGTMIVSMYQAKRSVANGALYDGTLITGWDALYSEGITAFNETRGFDMVTVAKVGEIDKINAACGSFMDYEDCLAYVQQHKASWFTGTKNADVILSNASEASTAAVNALLAAGKEVGMVTDPDSAFYGDFICSYTDYLTVADSYTLTATGIAQSETDQLSAQVISKLPTVYLTGEPAVNNNGGFQYANHTSGAYEWNYDRLAMELMNFTVTSDPTQADVIVGASALDEDALAAVLAGTPYIGYGGYAITSASSLLNVGYESLGGMDCLAYVTYGDESLINASYVMDGDDMLYGYNDYGVCYFSSLPEGAKTLVQIDGTQMPEEGFIPVLTADDQAAFDTFLNGSVVGMSYSGTAADGTSQINVALFANSLTHKVHQRDEYAYISNFVFSQLLGGTYDFTAPATGDSFHPMVMVLAVMASGAALVLVQLKKKHA